MFKLFVVLAIIASILLILVVLIQNPKGGFAANFINVNQFGGVAQTNKLIVRTTWTLAIIVLVFSILATISMPKASQVKQQQSDIYEYLRQNATTTTPVIPTTPIQNQGQ